MLSLSGNATIGFGGATSIAGPSNGLGISGNVGIGTTTATNNLTVIGNASFGADYGGYAAPANGLLIQGNVGIGLSNGAVGYALTINGNENLTNLTNGYNINVQNALSFPGTNGSFTNIGIGRSAGGSLTTGTNNVFIGDQAGMDTITGSQHTFVGFQTGQSNTANQNSAFGYQALLN